MLAETTTILDTLPNLGVAGIMGAMWLWERRTSSAREKQIDDAHQRIMSDGVKLEALIDLVQKNTDTLSRILSQNETRK